MPPPATISQQSALRVSRSHLGFTARNLDANALTKPLAAPLHTLLGEWMLILQMELDLGDQADHAAVLVVALDRDLNKLAKRISKELLTLTGDDTSHALYQHYFQGKALHAFVRPIMGKQLEAMRAWLPSLAASDTPALKALGQELGALIQQADTALKTRADADAALSRFRQIGERYQFINKVNAALKSAYGTLSAMPHDHEGLPSNFADAFFLRVRLRGEVETEPTVESVEEEIAALNAELGAKQAQLAELSAAREQAEKKLEAKALAQAKMAQLEKELSEKQKELEALSKELEA